MKKINEILSKIPQRWRWVIIPLFLLASYGAIKLIEYTQVKWEQNQEQK